MGENVVRMGKSVVMKPGMTISCHCPGKDRFMTFLLGTDALYTKSLPFWCALLPTLHYWDVTVASGHLKSLAPQLFVQQLIQGGNGENINAPHYMWMQEWLVDSPHKGLVMQSVSIPWFLWYLYSCIKSYNELCRFKIYMMHITSRWSWVTTCTLHQNSKLFFSEHHHKLLMLFPMLDLM